MGMFSPDNLARISAWAIDARYPGDDLEEPTTTDANNAGQCSQVLGCGDEA